MLGPCRGDPPEDLRSRPWLALYLERAAQCLECSGDSLVGYQRRVDAAREVAQVLERTVRLGADLGDEVARLRGIPVDHLFRQPSFDCQRDELLLRAVMDVALQAPTLFV